MARYRSRSRSYSPRRRSRTPPRGRKHHYDDEDPRDRRRVTRSHRDRRSPAPSGLLVRNLPLDARPEDLRGPFEKYGPVKDVYLPKNYYTGEPRGFGFVKYRYAEDAAEAKQRMNHKIIGGREIRIVYAEENRKTPQEMRTTARVSGRHGGSTRGRTPPKSPRRRHRSYSHSPSSARHDSRDRGAKDDYHSPRRSRSISRSRSPQDERDYRSNQRSPSPRENDQSPHAEREYASGGLGSPSGNGHTRSRSRSRSNGCGVLLSAS
ncbi:serine/arginine-rich SC35-like splicing factor SCL28 isoform X2 [Ricinus communis]|uniref:serine/arginine-rich SC35-like splicing factor SCL28 isoform X2 n=1 Tax=Ricinus communis TaxID=3988 RepID=UPI000D691055|nr:serine/arginine-rich SC35-like splicing factor SCL28 isoform X2 [Ricinus communis]|eukprot:XP_025012719.1 serine/arginine-rich SC35-like splicing factor SCL28 isoform X1 [Ricinus communis]